MSRVKRFFDRWKTDYDFKSVTAALGSLFATALFALYNGFLGVYHASLWHGSICVYYLVLVGLRTMIIAARKNADQRAQSKRAQTKVYVASAVLLLLLNLGLVVPVSLMVVRKKPVDMTLIPAIAMAAYTTYKVIMASVHLKRRKRSSDRLVRLLRTISFIDALVSVLTLQNTLIMVNMKSESSEMLTLSAITSAVIMLAVLALSFSAIPRGMDIASRQPNDRLDDSPLSDVGEEGGLPSRRDNRSASDAQQVLPMAEVAARNPLEGESNPSQMKESIRASAEERGESGRD